MKFMRANAALVIILSFVLAFIFTILPLPYVANAVRPQWILLVCIYWSMVLPHRFSLMSAWVLGFLLDIFQNNILGTHAFIFTVITYLVVKFQTRINFFPFWQKLSIVFGLILLGQILQVWLNSIANFSSNNIWYWLQTITTILFWPWVMLLLQHWQKKFNIC